MKQLGTERNRRMVSNGKRVIVMEEAAMRFEDLGRKLVCAASSTRRPGRCAARAGRAGASTLPPKPSAVLIRTVPATTSGRVTRLARSMAASASSAISSHTTPPDGSKFEVFATGLRAPNGMSTGPHAEITVSDNEGTWTPACRINLVSRGSFLGVADLAHAAHTRVHCIRLAMI